MAVRPRLEARSRWSLSVKCSRAGSYALLGVPPEDERLRADVDQLMGLDLDGLRRRGRRLGDVRADQYAARYGEENIIREKPVEWLSGTMHTDIVVIPERLAIEVKSVVPKSVDSIFDAAVLQCAGQIRFDDDVDHGLVEFMSPIDESVYQAVPVILNDDLRQRVEEVAHAVARAGITNGAELPDRVCQRPGDSPSRLCPFADHCFAGWQDDHPAIELDDPETIALVRSLYELKKTYRVHSAEAKACSDGYAEVQARLAELGVEPGRDYLVDGVKLRRIVSASSESFSLAKARKTGAWTEADSERLAPFVSLRSGSERWTVERVADPAPDDFGGEAPWTDADLNGGNV